MFTGLVEGRGTIQSIRSEGAAIRLEIEVPSELLGGDSTAVDDRPGIQPEFETGNLPFESSNSARVGDSVAINGCCLTIIEVVANRWYFLAGAETLAKTNLGKLDVGHSINLERPLPVNGRLGGHFVQGHIDGVGCVDAIERNGEWVTMWVRVPHELAMLMVPKGSIAIDGISLTLVDVEQDRLSVALIPHTLEVTNLGSRQVGDILNIETDILGKYVRKLTSAVHFFP